jgi:hypothetical protein
VAGEVRVWEGRGRRGRWDFKLRLVRWSRYIVHGILAAIVHSQDLRMDLLQITRMLILQDVSASIGGNISPQPFTVYPSFNRPSCRFPFSISGSKLLTMTTLSDPFHIRYSLSRLIGVYTHSTQELLFLCSFLFLYSRASGSKALSERTRKEGSAIIVYSPSASPEL